MMGPIGIDSSFSCVPGGFALIAYCPRSRFTAIAEESPLRCPITGEPLEYREIPLFDQPAGPLALWGDAARGYARTKAHHIG